MSARRHLSPNLHLARILRVLTLVQAACQKPMWPGSPPLRARTRALNLLPRRPPNFKRSLTMRKSGPGEIDVMCSQAPPSAAGTEGYALSIAQGLDSVAERGLKGGA